MSEFGFLSVRVRDQSAWLSNNLPFVVRDVGLAVVHRGRAGDPAMSLPAGLYSVEAVTPRGRAVQELVSVDPVNPAVVVVTEDSGRDADGRDAGVRAAAEAELIDTDGCRLLAEGEGSWTFGPDQVIGMVPTATFRVGDREWIASLPLNPQGRTDDETTCRVELDVSGPQAQLGVRFSARRRVGRVVDGLLRHDEVMAGAKLLDQAASLLLSKYGDPSAATLGGLTLHRFGRLRQRQDWVENLARDFGWIPDGRILLAALLMDDDDPAEQDRGLDVLVGATEGRPLYTDGLALATDLLRRWPSTERAVERTERLKRLAEYSCLTAWSSISLVTGGEGQWS